MTTGNQITLDHINSFLSIDGELEVLDLAPTATGGTGINNISEFPPPKPLLSVAEHKGTEYVQKYKGKEFGESFKNLSLSSASYCTLNDLNDVEDLPNEAIVDDSDEAQAERTRQIYSTYYSIRNKTYDPNLAITNYREEILQQLDISPVLIIQGPTGCGKTTQVPQYILDYYADQGKFCNIIVTQPRKIAAIGVANRVCQERRWQMGTLVGYQVAMDPRTSADTRLAYVTTGVLLEKLVHAKHMNAFTHVIIDEVHERNEDIDFALLLVKKFLLTNSQKVKVILMSATFDTSMFAEYFASPKGDAAPVIEIIGKVKEVTEHFLYELKTLIPKIPEFSIQNPVLEPCLYDAVVSLLSVFDKIEKSEQNVPADKEFAPKRGAVLIFLPGYDEICTLSDKLMAGHFNKRFWIIPLHSTITVEEQTKVFREPPFDHRKVILSTNIAESSITVPDVKYVIDFCLTKNLVTDPMTNYTCLQLEWASKTNCIQRKGRAGRVDIGKVYRMVPRPFYDMFEEYNTPEIQRCPLTKTILHLKKLGVCEPKEMLAFALDPPYLEDIESSVLQLKEALALYGRGSSYDGDLTFIGMVMASLPLDIKLSKLILFGYAFSCVEECIIIAASLSLQSFFARPFQKALESYRSRLSWADNSFSDCFAYLNAFKTWKRLSSQSYFLRPGGLKENQWCEKHYIQMKRIREVDKLIREIKARLEKFFIVHSRSEGKDEYSDIILKLVIASAFFPHYFLQEPLNEDVVIREVNDNDPLSTVVVSGIPPNQGLLYACTLRDLISCCGDQIDIEFEERKAYVKFGRNQLQSNSALYMPAETVALPVYLAVKMRELRMPFELFVFHPEEAERKLKQIKQSKSPSSEASLRFSVNLHVQTEKVKLPDPSQEFIKLFICYCDNCGHFWIRYLDEENDRTLKFIHHVINSNPENHSKPLSKKPAYNMLCLAPFVEAKVKQYYRALIKNVANDFAMVLFIDYGNQEKVPVNELRAISENTPDVQTTRPLAIECFLSEIKPKPSANSSGSWSEDANKWFKRMVNGAILMGKVYSVVNDTIRLELLKKAEDGTTQNINELLILKNYAEKSEESLSSRQNHEFRVTCKSYSSNTPIGKQLSNSFSNSLEFSLEDAAAFSSLKTTSRKIKLRGPYSPLEASYAGLTNMDRFRRIKVERDSVNSVSFNPEPGNTMSTMLIASHLTIGQKSDSLFARSTTLMPKLQGLPSLTCLLFAPYAEIRTDKRRSHYTGALCGLGYDSVTEEPLFKDHDIEVSFDSKITLEDISNINGIRMGINMLLQSKEESETKIKHCQKLLRKCIISLILKQRDPVEPEFFHKSGEWNQVPARLLLEPSVDSSADCAHVLPLHKPPGIISKT